MKRLLRTYPKQEFHVILNNVITHRSKEMRLARPAEAPASDLPLHRDLLVVAEPDRGVVQPGATEASTPGTVYIEARLDGEADRVPRAVQSSGEGVSEDQARCWHLAFVELPDATLELGSQLVTI